MARTRSYPLGQSIRRQLREAARDALCSWQKRGGLWIPGVLRNPMRMSPGYPCCCDRPLTCAGCASSDNIPEWVRVTWGGQTDCETFILQLSPAWEPGLMPSWDGGVLCQCSNLGDCGYYGQFTPQAYLSCVNTPTGEVIRANYVIDPVVGSSTGYSNNTNFLASCETFGETLYYQGNPSNPDPVFLTSDTGGYTLEKPQVASCGALHFSAVSVSFGYFMDSYFAYKNFILSEDPYNPCQWKYIDEAENRSIFFVPYNKGVVHMFFLHPRGYYANNTCTPSDPSDCCISEGLYTGYYGNCTVSATVYV